MYKFTIFATELGVSALRRSRNLTQAIVRPSWSLNYWGAVHFGPIPDYLNGKRTWQRLMLAWILHCFWSSSSSPTLWRANPGVPNRCELVATMGCPRNRQVSKHESDPHCVMMRTEWLTRAGIFLLKRLQPIQFNQKEKTRS